MSALKRTTPVDRKGHQVSHLPVRLDWLRLHHEKIIEPDLPIIDSHHHLWDRPNDRYLLNELFGDIDAHGHNVVATVFIECGAMYRSAGDERLRSVGETEFAAGCDAVKGIGRRGVIRACAAIVGRVDLLGGDRCKQELEAHILAGQGRFRGIRNITAWHQDPAARGSTATPPPGLLAERSFRQGFAHLGPLGLSFDAFMYHTQLSELADLAGEFPDTLIVLDHGGGPIGIGPYEDRRDEVFSTWSSSMRDLAKFDNIVVKLGGFGMRLLGFGFENTPLPPSSHDLARAWKPYIETCISHFGVDRCMFESNFPVDKGSCTYEAMWNAFKRIASGYSESEKNSLFSGTAARIYRVAF